MEHTILYFLFVVGTFDILANQAETVLLYIIFRTKEKFALPSSFCNILININTNKYPYFVDTVKERTKGKITRCAKKSYNCIKIADLWVML